MSYPPITLDMVRREELVELRKELKVGPRSTPNSKKPNAKKPKRVDNLEWVKPDITRRKFTIAESESFRQKAIVLATFDVHLSTVMSELAGSDFGAEVSLGRMNAVLGAARSDADIILIDRETLEAARAATCRWLPKLLAEQARIKALPAYPRRWKLLNCLGVVLWKLERFASNWSTVFWHPHPPVHVPALVTSAVAEGIKRVVEKSKLGEIRDLGLGDRVSLIQPESWQRVAQLPPADQVRLGMRLAVVENWDCVIAELAPAPNPSLNPKNN